jgi:hypothetical protein
MLSSFTRVSSHAIHGSSGGVPSLYTINSGNYNQYTYDGYTVIVFSTSGSISFNGAANKTVNAAVVGGGGSGGFPGGGGSVPIRPTVFQQHLAREDAAEAGLVIVHSPDSVLMGMAEL